MISYQNMKVESQFLTELQLTVSGPVFKGIQIPKDADGYLVDFFKVSKQVGAQLTDFNGTEGLSCLQDYINANQVLFYQHLQGLCGAVKAQHPSACYNLHPCSPNCRAYHKAPNLKHFGKSYAEPICIFRHLKSGLGWDLGWESLKLLFYVKS